MAASRRGLSGKEMPGLPDGSRSTTRVATKVVTPLARQCDYMQRPRPSLFVRQDSRGLQKKDAF
jgi:hypothetical protein